MRDSSSCRVSVRHCLCPLLCRPLQDFGLLHRADAGDQAARSVFQESAKGHRGEWQGELTVRNYKQISHEIFSIVSLTPTSNFSKLTDSNLQLYSLLIVMDTFHIHKC